MLRDPELREAYEAIHALHTEFNNLRAVNRALNELASVTMLLLRVVDDLVQKHAETRQDLRDLDRTTATELANLEARATRK